VIAACTAAALAAAMARVGFLPSAASRAGAPPLLCALSWPGGADESLVVTVLDLSPAGAAAPCAVAAATLRAGDVGKLFSARAPPGGGSWLRYVADVLLPPAGGPGGGSEGGGGGAAPFSVAVLGVPAAARPRAAASASAASSPAAGGRCELKVSTGTGALISAELFADEPGAATVHSAVWALARQEAAAAASAVRCAAAAAAASSDAASARAALDDALQLADAREAAAAARGARLVGAKKVALIGLADELREAREALARETARADQAERAEHSIGAHALKAEIIVRAQARRRLRANERAHARASARASLPPRLL